MAIDIFDFVQACRACRSNPQWQSIMQAFPVFARQWEKSFELHGRSLGPDVTFEVDVGPGIAGETEAVMHCRVQGVEITAERARRLRDNQVIDVG